MFRAYLSYYKYLFKSYKSSLSKLILIFKNYIANSSFIVGWFLVSSVIIDSI